MVPNVLNQRLLSSRGRMAQKWRGQSACNSDLLYSRNKARCLFDEVCLSCRREFLSVNRAVLSSAGLSTTSRSPVPRVCCTQAVQYHKYHVRVNNPVNHSSFLIHPYLMRVVTAHRCLAPLQEGSHQGRDITEALHTACVTLNFALIGLI